MQSAQHLEGLSPVDRLHDLGVHDVYDVLVLRISHDARVVPRPRTDQAFGAQVLPVVAVVVGAVDAAGVALGLDDGVHAVRVRARYGDADAPNERRRPAVARDALPRGAGVGALVDGASGPTAADLPGQALEVPERREQFARVRRVQRQVDGAHAVARVEEQRPVGAAVGALVDAAIRTEGPPAALGGRVDDVGIARVHSQLRDGFRGFETRGGPGLAGVGGAIHPVAPGGTLSARLALAHPGVHHVGVARGHGQRSDRSAPDEVVRDVVPAAPRVGRLPDATAGGAHVEGERFRRHTDHRGHAAAAVGADAAPVEPPEAGGVEGGRSRGAGRRGDLGLEDGRRGDDADGGDGEARRPEMENMHVPMESVGSNGLIGEGRQALDSIISRATGAREAPRYQSPRSIPRL